MEHKAIKPKEGKKRTYEQFAEFEAENPFMPKKERKIQQKLQFEAKAKQNEGVKEMLEVVNVAHLLKSFAETRAAEAAEALNAKVQKEAQERDNKLGF